MRADAAKNDAISFPCEDDSVRKRDTSFPDFSRAFHFLGVEGRVMGICFKKSQGLAGALAQFFGKPRKVATKIVEDYDPHGLRLAMASFMLLYSL